jgi:hypothetical protein
MIPDAGSAARFGLAIAAAVATLALTAGCGNLSEGPPTNLTLTAASDSTIRISWTTSGSAPDSYVIAFMETGTSTWLDVGGAADSATVADHNPAGKTGRYRVTAVFGARSYPSGQTPSSAPVHTGPIIVGELNSATRSGVGWSRDSGDAGLFDMAYASSGEQVDFYVTDWSVGHSGPAYYIASPDWGPYEPGGRGLIPVGPWRPNWFRAISSGMQAPLAAFDTASYANNLELFADSTFAAIVCTDTIFVADTLDTFATVSRHYAIARFGSPNTADGTVQVETWFQRIGNLRLIQH